MGASYNGSTWVSKTYSVGSIPTAPALENIPKIRYVFYMSNIDSMTQKSDIPRIYLMSFASVYPHYVTKAEKKGRTKADVDKIICWLTGYTKKTLASQLRKETTFEDFFAEAPKMNPARKQITGVVCGIRVEDIKEDTMREIRYLDKLIDELAKGKDMEKILRRG